jgi:hypothetical protein
MATTVLDRFSLFEGSALLSLAQEYPTLHEVILEAVQNALDEDAKLVEISLNYPKRRLSITDDGNGKTPEEFMLPLDSVGMSVKKKGKFGKFGRGMVSPIGKCERFIFTTCKKGQAEYNRWTFVTDELIHAKEIEGVPRTLCNDLAFSRTETGTFPKGKVTVQRVPWRTQVLLENITKDRVISRINIESLADEIVGRYNIVLLENDVTVRIEVIRDKHNKDERMVKGQVYLGDKIDERTFMRPESGFTIFRLFRAPVKKGKAEGRVVFGTTSDNYRISAQQFANCTRGEIDKDAMASLCSGVFEGEVLCQKIKFDPDRKSFERGDVLLDMCKSVEEWYERVGADLVAAAKSTVEQARWQRIGLQALNFLENLVALPDYSGIMADMKFGVALPSNGKAKSSESAQDKTSKDTDSIRHRPGTTDGDAEAVEKAKSKDDKPTLTVTGPKGKVRSVVKKRNTGLQIDFDTMPGSSKPYVFEPETGKITFNTRHPHFTACLKKDSWLLEYQIDVVQIALVVHAQAESYQPAMQPAFEMMLDSLVYRITNGDKLINEIRKMEDHEL